ncbi:MAG: RMD1 family protein [Crocinitomicaceae bacterium]
MTYTVSAYHIGRRIDLMKSLSKFHEEIVKDEPSFILLKRTETSFLYLKDHGSVVFCNFSEKEKKKVFKIFGSNEIDIDSFSTEEYEISIEPNRPEQVHFNTVSVGAFTVDVLHIVMLNLSQSVAMENYQNRTNALLQQTRQISDKLKLTGDIGLTRGKLRQFIGKTMVLRTRIAENLLIFETSDLAWSSEQLSFLDNQLREQLDMVNRHHGLQCSLNIVKENLDLFRDILHHKQSSTLEWIIIVLILLEVMDMVIAKTF